MGVLTGNDLFRKFPLSTTIPDLYSVTVKVTAGLSPPLSQPRSPERLAGVWTTTWALPGAEIWAVVIVASICEALTTVVGKAAPFQMTSEEE